MTIHSLVNNDYQKELKNREDENSYKTYFLNFLLNTNFPNDSVKTYSALTGYNLVRVVEIDKKFMVNNHHVIYQTDIDDIDIDNYSYCEKLKLNINSISFSNRKLYENIPTTKLPYCNLSTYGFTENKLILALDIFDFVGLDTIWDKIFVPDKEIS